MFDIVDFVHDISPVHHDVTADVLTVNRPKLSAIGAYKNLVDNLDEDDTIAPKYQTVTIPLDIALLLTAAGQVIYHTSPIPMAKL